jgi:holo-[acyl-carrier protein] synthase
MSIRIGVDLVQVSQVEASLARFGDRFVRRLFTEGEIADATAAPRGTAGRLAARLAAKEAALKALGLSDHGVGWRQIEVRRDAGGVPALALHGAARAAAAEAGVDDLAVSLSQAGDYAAAVVVAQARTAAA